MNMNGTLQKFRGLFCICEFSFREHQGSILESRLNIIWKYNDTAYLDTDSHKEYVPLISFDAISTVYGVVANKVWLTPTSILEM